MDASQSATPPVPKAKVPGIATASLILGIAGLLFGFLTGIPAIICGFVARKRINEAGGALGGDGTSMAGLVLGFITTIFSVMMSVILIPVLWSVKEGALTATARNDCIQLVNGLQAMRSEYNRFPIEASDRESVVIRTDKEFMKVLLAREGEGAKKKHNPRGIVFFEGRIQKREGTHGLDSEGNYHDPWGNLYEIQVDADYDGEVEGFGAGDRNEPIRKSVIARSWGLDGVAGTGDDVKSWE